MFVRFEVFRSGWRCLLRLALYVCLIYIRIILIRLHLIYNRKDILIISNTVPKIKYYNILNVFYIHFIVFIS